MRAIGHALVAILLLAGHAHLPPTRASGEDHRPRLQRGPVGQLHFDQATGGVAGRHQLLGALQVHHVHVVFVHVLFQRSSHLRTFGVRHRDEVLDRHGVQHLAAETLGRHASADALARGVDCRGRAGRTAADHQHVEGVPGLDLLRLAGAGAGVDLRQDLLQAHAALVEHLAVEEHGGHRHHLALLHLVLVQRTVDGNVPDVGVQHAHQVQRLHHVGAVLAGQREIGLEGVLPIEIAHLLDHVGRSLGRMAADLQQGQHERGEFMAHRDAGKAHADVGAEAVDREGRLARFAVVAAQADLVRQRGDLLQQLVQLARLGAVVQRRDQFDRLRELFQVGLQLRLEGFVEHGEHSETEKRGREACGSGRRHGEGAAYRGRGRPDAGRWHKHPGRSPGRAVAPGSVTSLQR